MLSSGSSLIAAQPVKPSQYHIYTAQMQVKSNRRINLMIVKTCFDENNVLQNKSNVWHIIYMYENCRRHIIM